MKTKKAVAPTTASQNELRNKAYPKAESLSNQKLHVGELLLFGHKQQVAFWQRFECELRRYLDLRISEGRK